LGGFGVDWCKTTAKTEADPHRRAEQNHDKTIFEQGRKGGERCQVYFAEGFKFREDERF